MAARRDAGAGEATLQVKECGGGCSGRERPKAMLRGGCGCSGRERRKAMRSGGCGAVTYSDNRAPLVYSPAIKRYVGTWDILLVGQMVHGER